MPIDHRLRDEEEEAFYMDEEGGANPLGSDYRGFDNTITHTFDNTKTGIDKFKKYWEDYKSKLPARIKRFESELKQFLEKYEKIETFESLSLKELFAEAYKD